MITYQKILAKANLKLLVAMSLQDNNDQGRYDNQMSCPNFQGTTNYDCMTHVDVMRANKRFGISLSELTMSNTILYKEIGQKNCETNIIM